MTKTWARYAGQMAAYAAFIALLGYFATAPAYRPVDPEAAMIKLSFIHVGQRKVECRKMSPEEIALLPPNMRLTLDCPRERLPVLPSEAGSGGDPAPEYGPGEEPRPRDGEPTGSAHGELL